MFFKNLSFPDFQSIEPVAQLIENAIKLLITICLARLVPDWCWIDWICFSIDWILFSTNWNSIWKCFKEAFLMCSSHFSNFSNSFLHYSSSTNRIQAKFVTFFLKFLKGFCLFVLVSIFYPFFFNLFTIFMHFSCILVEIFKLILFGVFEF